MYYVYCPETGDEIIVVDEKEDAVKTAQEMIRTQMLDEAADSGEVLIFEPTMVVYGSVDVNFKVETYSVIEEEDTNDKDLSVTESSTTEN